MANKHTMQGMTHDLAIREIMEYGKGNKDFRFCIGATEDNRYCAHYGEVNKDGDFDIQDAAFHTDHIIATIDLALQLRKYKK